MSRTVARGGSQSEQVTRGRMSNHASVRRALLALVFVFVLVAGAGVAQAHHENGHDGGPCSEPAADHNKHCEPGGKHTADPSSVHSAPAGGDSEAHEPDDGDRSRPHRRRIWGDGECDSCAIVDGGVEGGTDAASWTLAVVEANARVDPIVQPVFDIADASID